MKYFIENNSIVSDDYRFVFLCGSKFNRNNKRDKRKVLKALLDKENDVRTIILEDNFAFNTKNDLLGYEDIDLFDLYHIETLVNCISDSTIIIHESISTGAEAGLFLGNQRAWNKTCLLIPEITAVEEDKLGAFLRYVIRKTNNRCKLLYFTPTINKHYTSNTLSVWYTFFIDDSIGTKLKKEILDFVNGCSRIRNIVFSNDKNKSPDEGFIYYKIDDTKLHITIGLRVLLICISALFSIKDYRDEFITRDCLRDVIACIYEKLKELCINSVMEINGSLISSCTVKPSISSSNITIHQAVGMCLYLYKAADLITINTTSKKEKSKKLFSFKVQKNALGKNELFYQRYSNIIKEVIPDLIK